MALSERLFAAGLEQLSGNVVQLQADAKSRLDTLEQRLAGAEKTARFNTDALDHALEKIDGSANQRAIDQVEAQRRAAMAEQRFNLLEDCLARLEMRLPDAGLARRLETIEQMLNGAAEQLKHNDPTAQFSASMQALSHRQEALEKTHKDLLDELRARFLAPAAASEPPPAVEAPPLVEPPNPNFNGQNLNRVFDGDTAHEASVDPVEYSTTTVPDFEEIFLTPETEKENFLAQARRSARAAPEKPKPRYLFPGLVALTMVLALAAGLALSGRMKQQAQIRPAASSAMRTFSLPEPPDGNGDNTQFVVAPQADDPSDAPPRAPMPPQPRTVRNARINPVPGSARNAPTPDRVIQLANAGNPAALTILGLRALDSGGNLPDAVKFLTQAAEKGQAVAQYRLGTLYEHAQGVAADPAKAAHWYELAASQGNRKAMHNLAVFNASGASGKKNMAEAARWFAKAAALGLSDSQFNLAVLYERGDGLPQSLLDAFKWYSIASASGDGESKARISVLQTQLGDADKATASKSAGTFHAAPLDHTANVPPDAGSLGS